MVDKRSTGLLPLLVVAVVVIVLMPAAYMGAYYVLLEGVFADSVAQEFQPRYRWKNMTVFRLFVPANNLDRNIRPNYWNYPAR